MSMNTTKRARSPEEGSSLGDRPLKRFSVASVGASGRVLYRQSSTPSTSRHPSEDWVQQAGGLRINSPFYPPSEPFSTPPREDVDMAMDSDERAMPDSGHVNFESVVMNSSTNSSHSHTQDMQHHGPALCTPKHGYSTRYAERMQASVVTPDINVASATLVNNQQYVHHPPPAQGLDNPPSAQAVGLLFSATRPSTPPPASPAPMAISPTNSFAQLVNPSTAKTIKKRVVFGPRANCERCRLGERHFTHYESSSNP